MNEGSGDSLAPVCHEDQNREKESKREKNNNNNQKLLKRLKFKGFSPFFFSQLSPCFFEEVTKIKLNTSSVPEAFPLHHAGTKDSQHWLQAQETQTALNERRRSAFTV